MESLDPAFENFMLDPRRRTLNTSSRTAIHTIAEGSSCCQQSCHDDDLYCPLKLNEIRVLEILPGPEEDIIECRLKRVELGASKYNALSYTWGDPKNLRVLTINGKRLEVTENCMLALKELRRESVAQAETCFIWIDAICINQKDLPERSQQVLLMRRIYKHSAKLIIWLGPEGDGSPGAIEIMKEMAEACSQGNFEEWRVRFEEHPQFLQRWRSLASFISRSWFGRVWVIQEYVACSQIEDFAWKDRFSDFERVSKNIEFYCGAARMSPNVLHRVLFHGSWLNAPRFKRENINAGVATEISNLLKSLRSGARCFLIILQRVCLQADLNSTKEIVAHIFFQNIMLGLEFHSTEPRDKIYAHLPFQLGPRVIAFKDSYLESLTNRFGCTKDVAFQVALKITQSISFSLSKLIVNYDRSVEDVYSSLVSYMVFATGSLNILSLCNRRSIHIRRTWVYDLAAAYHYEGDHFQQGGLLADSMTNDTFGCISFCASKKATADATFSPDLSVLSVKGFRITTVVMTLDLREKIEQKFWPAFFPSKVFWKGTLEILSNVVMDEAYESRQKALWNTMIGATKIDNELESFERWCSWLDKDTEGLPMWDVLVHGQLNRRLFLASNLRVGKGWSSVKEGDIVCIILGCDVPLVLRPMGDYYEVIGDCYVDGIMQGEAMEYLEDGKAELETFGLH